MLSLLLGGMLKKRGREDEGLADLAGPESKILYRKTEQLFHLLEDMDSLDKIQDDECCASEELVSCVMRNLEEEIGLTACSIFPEGSSGEDLVTSDMTSCSGSEEGGFDLCHLLGASDDELGIPPSSVVNLEEQAAFSLPFEFGENQEINASQNGVDYFQNLDVALDVRDFVIVEQDYPTAWRLESTRGVY
ncbi:hypothetical protein SUGI_0075170 [Cryptomeria japonica]|nr:hypothetical protein SUGI_0075170 [Cryptomeria japonica]